MLKCLPATLMHSSSILRKENRTASLTELTGKLAQITYRTFFKLRKCWSAGFGVNDVMFVL